MVLPRVLAAAALLSFLVCASAYADDQAPSTPAELPPAGGWVRTGEEPVVTPPPVTPPVAGVPVSGVPVASRPVTASPRPVRTYAAPCAAPCAAPTVRQFDRSVRTATRRDPTMGTLCTSRCGPSRRRCPGYAGAVLQAYPGLGFGLEFGMWFCRSNAADVAWEVNLNYQDLTDGFNNIRTGQSGKWVGARVGLKASFCPQGNSHPTLRAGLAWNIATGDVNNNYDLGDIPDTPFAINYFGGYLGVGWEWDLFGGCLTTGPEIWGFAGPLADRPEGDDGAYTATIAWHVVLNF